MMPDKLYIPTSTLNFNNIMSSESISPAGFYPERGFGYKRFEKVGPNNLNKRIILYDKYPIFEINNREQESYPMIIEIDIKTVQDEMIQTYKDGVYYSEETVYLNPFTTKFFFGNESEKLSTLSKAEPSIETKMVVVYQKCFCIRKTDIESFVWQSNEMKDTIADFDIYISKDRRINKLKGFLYAYLLGANTSLLPEIVALKKDANELKNVLSAMIASFNGRETSKQGEQLRNLYQSINRTFCDEEIQNIIKKKEEEYGCDFEYLLKNEGIYNDWRGKHIEQPFQPFSGLSNSSPNDRWEAFNDYISKLEIRINKIAVPKNIKMEDLPIVWHCRKIECISHLPDFLSKLLNEYLNEAYNYTDFLQSRYDFALSGGKLLKEECHEEWESKYQVYINALLKNLKEYTPFTLKETDDLILQSFGAFCQKGEDDICKLENYLISNNIGDFRIAFAFWGIIFGFANIPKTLTNKLFKPNDDYVSKVYKYIFKQVHGIDLDEPFERKQGKESEFVLSNKNDDMNRINVEADSTINVNSANDSFSKFESKLQRCKGKGKGMGFNFKQIEEIKEVYKKNGNEFSKPFLNDVSQIEGIGPKKLNQIKEYLGYTDSSTTSQISSLFEEKTSTGDFYTDENNLNN